MKTPWKRIAQSLGIFPLRWSRLRYLPRFIRDYRQFRLQCKRLNFIPTWSNLYPVLGDHNLPAGIRSIGYFQQDLWAARKVRASGVLSHTDIGSLVEGFVAHVLSFTEVKYVDIRPLPVEIPGLHFVQDDATHLEVFEDDSQLSLSSLHAAEHFGLGRYGDPIDPEACFSFMHALQRVLAPGGKLYFSTPVGRERTEFNGHRVFAPTTIAESFNRLRLVSFSVVALNGELLEGCDLEEYGKVGLATGLFEFTK